jgi:hypothetical protein
LLWQQEALQIYNAMLAKHDTQLAAEWKAFYPTFHQEHPQYSPQQVLSAFVGEVVAGGIGSAIGQTGSVLGEVPGAAAKGAENVVATLTNPLDWLKYPADFFHRLTEASTWIRVGEFVVGGMLIYVGLKALLTPGQQSAIRSTKKAAGGIKGAVTKTAQTVTPTGRATRVIARHETRVKAARTRQRATVIRGKQREFGRRELYRWHFHTNSGRTKTFRLNRTLRNQIFRP